MSVIRGFMSSPALLLALPLIVVIPVLTILTRRLDEFWFGTLDISIGSGFVALDMWGFVVLGIFGWLVMALLVRVAEPVSGRKALLYTSPLLVVIPSLAYMFLLFFDQGFWWFFLLPFWLLMAGFIGAFAPVYRNSRMYSIVVVFPLMAAASWGSLGIAILLSFIAGLFGPLIVLVALLAGAAALRPPLPYIIVAAIALAISIAAGLYVYAALPSDQLGGYVVFAIPFFLAIVLSALWIRLYGKPSIPAPAMAAWAMIATWGLLAISILGVRAD